MSSPDPGRAATAEATQDIGRRLASRLQAGDIILLEGDLAAGKTTLVRGLLDGLGGDPDEVSSPTFVLIQTYTCRLEMVKSLHHIDLYRLGENVTELRELGLEEVLSDAGAIVAVEWPKDTLATWVPSGARVWRVGITVGENEDRMITISSPE